MNKRHFISDPIKTALVCAFFFSSCLKLVQTPPASTQLLTATVFSSDEQAQLSMAGLYSDMMSHPRWLFNGAISLYTSLSVHELRFNTPPQNALENAFASESLTGNNDLSSSMYNAGFSYVQQANSIGYGLTASNSVSAGLKNRLLGEAGFSRALSYFYLVNLFGNVPLVTGTDYKTNATILNSTATVLYTQITNDLLDAQMRLPEQYTGSLTSPNDRIYPNKMAATALLARVYLYQQNWQQAALQASSVINDSSLYVLEPPGQVFLAQSREAIWQLQPVNKRLGLSTGEGNIFLPGSYGIDSSLLQAFDSNDLRRSTWIKTKPLPSGITYPYKYTAGAFGPNDKEYNVVLRLAEQYLIRAEARAQNGDLNGAAADLNRIRERAGLAAVAFSDQGSLLAAIYHENQVEFFAEWGHRWLDLKRLGLIDGVMQNILMGGWEAHDALYPFPSTELQLNPGLIQNPDY